MSTSRWLTSPAKRGFDVVVASVFLVIVSPVIVLVAAAVRVLLGAPYTVNQQRAGRHGHPIGIVKFRSMTNERDADGELLPDEQRLGRVGRVLRGTSLDELPQLWSVVRGDMSLVGPRPLPLTYVDRYSPEQRRRLDATPGITGWAQVQGRNALSWPDKLALDVWYVEHASLWVDLRILVRTVRTVFGHTGVSAEGHATMPEFMGDT
jgi:sugar transferase EpsL